MTPQQAGQAALAYARGYYGEDPPLAVRPPIWEGPDGYSVTVDAADAVAGNEDARLVDTPLLMVDKRTGAVTTPPWTEVLDAREQMRPVGH